MTPLPGSLRQGAVAVLETPVPADKIALTHALASAWREGALPLGPAVTPPPRPARPPRPELRLPRDMPKRRAGGASASRIALLHALAHIELNAIDLAWDLIARFPPPGPGFSADWLGVAADEARHYTLLAGRLAELGAEYGDLPAHDGLWRAAEGTAHDLLARLAVVPMVLEARGLDVTPPMIANLTQAGDHDSAAILRVIYADEIGHVAIGRRWFDAVCATRGLAPEPTWQDLVRHHYRGVLKRPFNHQAREAAGLRSASYELLASPGNGA